MSPSLIKTRNVQLWHNWTRDEAANFFVGAILCDDIRTVLRIARDDRPMVVGGGDPLRTVFATLLAHEGVKNLIVVDDETARIASNVGAMMVYREHIRQNNA